MHVCVYWSCLKGGVWWKTAFMKRKINFLCHTTSAAVTKISDLIGWLGWEAAHDWPSAWTEPTIYNCITKWVWKNSVAKHLALLLFIALSSAIPHLTFSFPPFPSLTIPPRSNASFPYRPLHLSFFFFSGRFTDSTGAYSCHRPPKQHRLCQQ